MQKLIFFALVILGAWWFTSTPDTEAITLPDGSYEYPGYTFSNSETYVLEALVLARENYRMGREAELSPTDLALGWGPMADAEVIADIEISQRGRWYYWQTDQYPIPHADIQNHSANVHMVPANDAVAENLARIDEGEKIRLTGKLVDIHAADGWRWTSSRSRTDTGNGSCELMLLERIDWL